MSFVIAAPELVQGASQQLANLGSALADASATLSGPTTAIAAAAQDEVSIAIAALFGGFGKEFEALGAQAQAFHAEFVNLLNASAGSYAAADAAAATGLDPIARWQQVFASTGENAQTVFSASGQALNSLAGGTVSALRQLPTNPAAFFGRVQTALQSLVLLGSPPEVIASVLDHTLGGVTYATNPGAIPPDPVDVLVNAAHIEVYEGLLGDGYIPPSGLDGLVLSSILNFASSPVSGVLVGAIGPFVSPGVALFNSGLSIFGDLTGGNPAGAFNTLLNTPANVVDGFFNGATLNIDPLAPIFNPFVEGGSGGAEQLTGLSFAFGGLFSPGQVVTGAGGAEYYGVGGSAFNSLGMDLSFFPPDDFAGGSIAIPAIPIGPIGAAAGLVDIIGRALGGTLIA